MDETILKRIDSNIEKSLERLFQLMRIPSISTDPAYAAACRDAADWCAAALTEMGFEARTVPTAGHPMVVAHHKQAGPGRPHVLFYGHYDVQPVDPLELWNRKPFDPAVEDENGRKVIRGRGAVDDKGQLMTFLEACRAMIGETGALPLNVSVLLEGEEESGSPSLEPFLEAHAEEVKADLALVCDTGMWNRQTPAVTVMLRGLVGEEITVTAADMDLHSGIFGGAARNPIHVLAEILAGLHDETGRVALPGFYDEVEELPDDVRTMWEALDFDGKAFLQAVGLEQPAGETDRSVLEQVWSRPTAEVNGISGGYTGRGFKTVLPATAHAKVSFRLVARQDPEKIRRAFRAYVESRIPDDCDVTFVAHGGAPALRIAFDSSHLQAARSALEAEWGTPAALVAMGGSIPIVGELKRRLDMDALMIGFGLEDDRMHSPNEKYDWTSFHGGIRSWARVLDALAR